MPADLAQLTLDATRIASELEGLATELALGGAVEPAAVTAAREACQAADELAAALQALQGKADAAMAVEGSP